MQQASIQYYANTVRRGRSKEGALKLKGLANILRGKGGYNGSLAAKKWKKKTRSGGGLLRWNEVRARSARSRMRKGAEGGSEDVFPPLAPNPTPLTPPPIPNRRPAPLQTHHPPSRGPRPSQSGLQLRRTQPAAALRGSEIEGGPISSAVSALISPAVSAHARWLHN